jgi:AcrR family transcriptional regulator
MADEKKYRMKELERLSGFNRSTIHFYTREGILPPPRKTGRTSAYYDDTHLRRLNTIRKMKSEYGKATGRSRMPITLLRALRESGGAAGGSVISETLDFDADGLDRHERRRMEIIAAALTLYTVRGYYRTSVRDIAREAGVSAPTFYLYFPNKQELFVEIIEYVIGKFKKDYREALQQEGDLIVRGYIMLEAFRHNYPLIGEVLNQLRSGAAAKDPWAVERLKKIYHDLTEDFTAEIKEAIAEGLYRDLDPELLAYIFITLAEATFQRLGFDDEYAFEDIAETMIECVYNGLNPAPRVE